MLDGKAWAESRAGSGGRAREPDRTGVAAAAGSGYDGRPSGEVSVHRFLPPGCAPLASDYVIGAQIDGLDAPLTLAADDPTFYQHDTGDYAVALEIEGSWTFDTASP